ncbi:hypothetical protein ACFYM2_22120 [Streptomyces sp. NPDC006711]|uniref:hypothetical protein n=1 Tax=unclassified Streptomyces TaxID=2593676 RepID=UPI00340B2244
MTKKEPWPHRPRRHDLRRQSLVGLGDWWANPTDEDFGANVMQNDTGSFLSGHSSYWDYNEGQASTSLKNQAAVIAGRYGDVKLE